MHELVDFFSFLYTHMLGHLKLIVCFASKDFRNPMREGENTAQTPGKSTGLFHCHLHTTKHLHSTTIV